MSPALPDIVVVGGGISGFSAAIAAAAHAKVWLVERGAQIGGDSTQANVGTICGTFYRTQRQQPQRVGYPFMHTLLTTLRERSQESAPLHHFQGLYVVPYNVTVLQTLMEEELHAQGVRTLLSSAVTDVVANDGLITSITIQSADESFTLSPSAVVDCTGVGIVAEKAGEPMLRDPNYQAASQVFRLAGVGAADTFSLGLALRRALMKAEGLPKSYQGLSLVPGSLRSGYVDLKLPLPDTITDLPYSLEAIQQAAYKHVNEITAYLVSTVSWLSGAHIDKVFPRLGVRVQQRPQGRYVLTETDVLDTTSAHDGIALGTWPIEEWTTDGEVTLKFFPEDSAYEIPARCLYAKNIKNLFYGGKSISATSAAIGSARVMGTCMQTGYAGGKLAASPPHLHESVIALLREELQR